MRNLRTFCLSIAAALWSMQTNAQQALSNEDLALARQIEATAIQELKSEGAARATITNEELPNLRSTTMGRQGKSVVTEVSPIRAEQPGETQQARVSRYDYATGLTFSTVVDLAERDAVEIKAEANVPTPLAPEEIARAVEIAAQAVPQLQSAAPNQIQLLPILDTAPQSTTYAHRLNLGDPRANEIEIVEREHDPNSAAADLIHRRFANGAEGGELWDAERFTSLMVTSPAMNRHEPASRISYKLVSMRSGSTRTFRPHTQYDFWVSRIPPEHADRELRFREVNEYVRNPEPLEGHPLALWTATALHHIPRTEDFGAAGFNASEGVAIMMWTGFDLMPHNLWDKTPLFERD